MVSSYMFTGHTISYAGQETTAHCSRSLVEMMPHRTRLAAGKISGIRDLAEFHALVRDSDANDSGRTVATRFQIGGGRCLEQMISDMPRLTYGFGCR